MREILFDADAFLCVRGLSLLTALDVPGCTWVMTGLVARKELRTILAEVAAFESSKRLRVEQIPSRGTPAADAFKDLCRQGYHQGEAEAVAWAMQLERGQRPLFISNDREARGLAKAKKIPVGDVMDLIIEAIDGNLLTVEQATAITAVWSDKRQGQCKPRDFTTFAEVLKNRRASCRAG